MSKKMKRSICGWVGVIGFLMSVGFVGGIEQGASLGNFVYAFASMIGSGFAFYKGGFMR